MEMHTEGLFDDYNRIQDAKVQKTGEGRKDEVDGTQELREAEEGRQSDDTAVGSSKEWMISKLD